MEELILLSTNTACVYWSPLCGLTSPMWAEAVSNIPACPDRGAGTDGHAGRVAVYICLCCHSPLSALNLICLLVFQAGTLLQKTTFDPGRPSCHMCSEQTRQLLDNASAPPLCNLEKEMKI